MKKYIVKLSQEERAARQKLLGQGEVSARQLTPTLITCRCLVERENVFHNENTVSCVLSVTRFAIIESIL